MLAYAPRPERRRVIPTALVLIVGAHVIAIAAVMSARMTVTPHGDPPTVVTLIEEPRPKPPKPQPSTQHPATPTHLTMPDPLVDPPPLPGPDANILPPNPLPPLPPGPTVDPTPIPKPAPAIHSGPRFVTPPDDIRPPYPEPMRAAELETTLRLRLAIDEHGRVTSVEAVGKADPVFLAAARRHILKAWRYTPAMEGDQAVPSTTVVTLKFELG